MMGFESSVLSSQGIIFLPEDDELITDVILFVMPRGGAKRQDSRYPQRLVGSQA